MAADGTWPDVLTSLLRGHDLSADASQWAMNEILTGNATPVQVAAFAVALRAKGESVAELAGLADAMLANANPIDLPREAVDVVGSGGDRANTVNISTMAALVAASAGAVVVKHGNRAASSRSGTADVLEELGVRLDVPAEAQPGVLNQTGITFLFAPQYHPALRHASSARRELGIQTTFNFLGPLANPARPIANAVGVADERIAGLVAGVLAGRGARGLVFHGSDGLDELTTTTTSRVWLIADGEVAEQRLDPADLGVQPARPEDLVGGEPAVNAQVVRDLVAGVRGPVRDIVAVNAAAALLAWQGPDTGADVAGQLARAYTQATDAIDSGAAAAKLDEWVRVSQSTR